ncbi:unnamed protein product [Trypanosoma congolense IL3000]|uniref:WGS project CAEQ00000000 data, annotated contig 1278 n=1 Tax=Trypanosoma congolense (strain IL3000) TaxID=1068625 RepID=F9W559_TRYCI|nr:unnamed protein product [Trypanosoma congolense IL3000]
MLQCAPHLMERPVAPSGEKTRSTSLALSCVARSPGLNVTGTCMRRQAFPSHVFKNLGTKQGSVSATFGPTVSHELTDTYSASRKLSVVKVVILGYWHIETHASQEEVTLFQGIRDGASASTSSFADYSVLSSLGCATTSFSSRITVFFGISSIHGIAEWSCTHTNLAAVPHIPFANALVFCTHFSRIGNKRRVGAT